MSGRLNLSFLPVLSGPDASDLGFLANSVIYILPHSVQHSVCSPTKERLRLSGWGMLERYLCYSIMFWVIMEI